MWFGSSPSCEKELPRRSRVFTQVADENSYITQQAARIVGLHNQFMMIDGRLTEASNEASMNHNYTVGLHCSVVEITWSPRGRRKEPIW